MAFVQTLPFVIAVVGDGSTTHVLLSIEHSPAFVGVLHLDSPRMRRPTSVEVLRVEPGPDSFVAPLIPCEHTHRPMVDKVVDHEVHVTRPDGTLVVETRQKTIRAEGDEVTEIVHRPGEPVPLPTVTAEVMSDGFLDLTIEPAIPAGEWIGISGVFVYELGDRR